MVHWVYWNLNTVSRNNKSWIKFHNLKQILLCIGSQQRSRNSVITKIHKHKWRQKTSYKEPRFHRMDQIICKALRKKLQRGLHFSVMWCCITGQYISPSGVDMSTNIQPLRMRQIHCLKTPVTDHSVMQLHISIEQWTQLHRCRSLKTHNLQWVSNL